MTTGAKPAHPVWRFWPLIVLCVLVGSRWLVEQASPDAVSGDLSGALGCFLAGCVTALLRVLSRRGAQRTSRSAISLSRVLAGGCVLSAVGISAALADRRVHSSDVVLALALTPTVLRVALSSRRPENTLGNLWPGLIGLGGLLLLLSTPVWSSWRYGLALLSLPLVMAAALSTLDSAPKPRSVGTEPLWTGAVLLGALALLQRMQGLTLSVHLLAVVLDGATAWLTVFALARVEAEQFTAQFFLVPLVAALEGFVLLRPTLDLRSCIGLSLLAVAGGALLFVNRREEPSIRLCG